MSSEFTSTSLLSNPLSSNICLISLYMLYSFKWHYPFLIMMFILNRRKKRRKIIRTLFWFEGASSLHMRINWFDSNAHFIIIWILQSDPIQVFLYLKHYIHLYVCIIYMYQYIKSKCRIFYKICWNANSINFSWGKGKF